MHIVLFYADEVLFLADHQVSDTHVYCICISCVLFISLKLIPSGLPAQFSAVSLSTNINVLSNYFCVWRRWFIYTCDQKQKSTLCTQHWVQIDIPSRLASSSHAHPLIVVIFIRALRRVIRFPAVACICSSSAVRRIAHRWVAFTCQVVGLSPPAQQCYPAALSMRVDCFCSDIVCSHQVFHRGVQCRPLYMILVCVVSSSQGSRTWLGYFTSRGGFLISWTAARLCSHYVSICYRQPMLKT